MPGRLNISKEQTKVKSLRFEAFECNPTQQVDRVHREMLVKEVYASFIDAPGNLLADLMWATWCIVKIAPLLWVLYNTRRSIMSSLAHRFSVSAPELAPTNREYLVACSST